MLRILGIDPGAKGGIALATPDSAEAQPMPLKLTAALKLFMPIDLAIVEQVHAMPGQGVSSCFSFGMAYGRVLEALDGLNIPFRLIDPKAWHKAVLGTPDMHAEWSRAQRRAEWKRLACAYCATRWPGLSLKRSIRCTTDHDGMADALCLATIGL